MPVRFSQHRVRVEELVALLGEQATTTLIRHCGGRRVPSPAQYLQALRRRLVVDDWLNHGFSRRDLAAKYGVAPSYVKKLVTQRTRQRHLLRAQDA
jgi:hypothetical protein